MRTKTYALYKRVHEMTITEDEGSLSLLNPEYNLMAEFDDILPIVISPAVLKDERRQHLVSILLFNNDRFDTYSVGLFDITVIRR